MAPGDAAALRFLNGRAAAEPLPNPIAAAEAAVKQSPSPENYLNLSQAYYRAGRFRDAIGAAEEALKLRPDFAEAYNNIGAAHGALAEWDAAIASDREAVRLNPDMQLARNNLAYAVQQKHLAETQRR